jgi:general secretion pathway protein A
MYLDHFELNAKPFQITTDPKFLWLGEKHKEALATLRYGIEDNRGFLLLTGEVGTGKTILINRLISLLNIDTVVATLPDPDLESMDFYNLLADGLNMHRSFTSKGAFLMQLRDFLHQSYADKKQVLLIIDESQRLNHRLMEDIRVLSNIELQDRKLINIFFVGQQEFNNILMTPQNRALAQRITVRYHIEALDQQETGAYIRHRLKVAGSKTQIFKQSAIDEVFRFSGGIPRLINIVCDHAMLTAYGKNSKQVDAGIVSECAEELRIPMQRLRTDAATLRAGERPIRDDGVVPDAPPVRPVSSGAGQGQISEPQSEVRAGADVPKPPLAWKFAYVVFIALLIGALAYGISRYTGAPEPRYKDSDLTPQKYKTTLEKEQERLADQLKQKPSLPVESKPAAANPKSSTAPATDGKAATNTTQALSEVGKPAAEGGNDQTRSVARPGPDAIEAKKDTGIDQTQIAPLPLMKAKVSIQFDINSNEIEADSYLVLERVAQYLVEHPEQVVNVKGYTDISGSSGYNETVSRFRANAVKTYLIGKGVGADNIKIFAMGDADPVESNDTADGRKKNRRVEIEFVQGQTAGN